MTSALTLTSALTCPRLNLSLNLNLRLYLCLNLSLSLNLSLCPQPVHLVDFLKDEITRLISS